MSQAAPSANTPRLNRHPQVIEDRSLSRPEGVTLDCFMNDLAVRIHDRAAKAHFNKIQIRIYAMKTT